MRWIVPLLLLVPAVAAQAPTETFELDFTGPDLLTPDGETVYAGNLTVGCGIVLENNGEADAHVEAHGLPVGINASVAELHFGIENCLGAEEVTKPFEITVTTDGAVGLVPFAFMLEAEVGEGGEVVASATQEVMVDYVPGHTVDPEGDRVFTVDGGTYEFPLHIEITANAKTMVMFEDKTVSGTASLNGLKATIFDVGGGQTNETFDIVFTAPTEAWTEETVTFYTYSHCLDKEDCGENNAQTITWTFQNANPGATPSGDEPVGEESPGMPLFAAILGIAVLVWRKRA